MIITSDGSYRGNKAIDLKGIIDEAVEKCTTVEKVLVVKEPIQKSKLKKVEISIRRLLPSKLPQIS
jgi:acetyl-CoA synthetase